MDALVKALVADATANGVVDHFRGKGAKKGSFRAHYLHMWDKVGPAPRPGVWALGDMGAPETAKGNCCNV